MADSQVKTANLFDKDNPDIVEYYTNSTTGVYTYSQNTRSVIIPCQPNKTYSATKSVQGTAPRFSLSCYDNYPQENDIATARVVNNDAMQLTLTTTANSQYLVLFFYYLNPPNVSEIQQIMDTLMVNEGQPLPYEPYGWLHSLRKLATATEAVENPLYSDGSPITSYTLKGNTVQNGTPTPSNPVEVNGVGVRTINLFSSQWEQGSINADSGQNQPSNVNIRTADYIEIKTNTIYSMTRSIGGGDSSYITLRLYDENKNYIGYGTPQTIQLISGRSEANPMREDINFCCFKIFSSTNAKYLRLQDSTGNLATQFMMVEDEYTAQTMPAYEPYGYKIPIPNGQQTTNIYLGSTQTVRQIKKVVFDGTENWNESACSIGYRFVLPITGAMPSDTTIGVRSMCTHQILTSTGNTYNTLGTYTITGTPEIIMTLDGDTRLASWKLWLAAQYANGTPVTVWYVLATPETAAVNEPLMKIGTYADTLSNAAQIPTAEGANSITVDTTVQPSEFTATWTGWHDSSVKEYDGSDWNE